MAAAIANEPVQRRQSGRGEDQLNGGNVGVSGRKMTTDKELMKPASGMF